MAITVDELVEWTGGQPWGPLPEKFEGVCIDSRKAAPGMLYVGLKGEHVHGRDFARHALSSGAVLALVDGGPVYGPSGELLPCIAVDDTHRALAAAARGYRRALKAKIAGVTGSAGKTSTKEFMAAFLRGSGKTSSTFANNNNDIGMPLSLLNSPRDCAFGVFECGSNHPGEIARLADILQPDCAAITSIGEAHIANFGSIDETAREKSALVAAIPESGFFVIARENIRFEMLKKAGRARVVEISTEDPTAPYYIVSSQPEVGRFSLREPDGSIVDLDTGLPGIYNIGNALIAYAAARNLGATAESCARALEGFSLPGRRWRKTEIDGVLWIDDAYNANPSSMKAALGNFATWPCKGLRIAVLGDMFELGERSRELHEDVARFAAQCRLDIVVTAGAMMASAFAPAYAAAAPHSKIFCTGDALAAREVVKPLLREGDTVLLKGSRGMEMEKVYEPLEE